MSSDTLINAHETLRREFRDLEDDLKRARDDLEITADRVIRRAFGEAKFIAEFIAEIDPDDLTGLDDEAEKAEEAIADAFADHDWRVARALSDFNKALKREPRAEMR